MSLETVAQFFEAVSQDEALQTHLKATRHLEAVVKVARNANYNFTAVELKVFIQQRSPQNETQLTALRATDEQLDAWWKFAWETGDIDLLRWVDEQRDSGRGSELTTTQLSAVRREANQPSKKWAKTVTLYALGELIVAFLVSLL